MTHEDAQEIMNRLDTLLDMERAALLAGELEKIPLYLEEKERLIDALADCPPEGDTGLRALQEKVDRNQALLGGTLQGIRKVAARMAAFRRIRRSLETYDDKGRKQTLEGDVDRRMEKRA